MKTRRSITCSASHATPCSRRRRIRILAGGASHPVPVGRVTPCAPPLSFQRPARFQRLFGKDDLRSRLPASDQIITPRPRGGAHGVTRPTARWFVEMAGDGEHPFNFTTNAQPHTQSMNAHCCTRMTEAVTSSCDEHPNRFDCPDALIHYSERSRAYGIIVHDGGSSVVSIAFCPWCSSPLAERQKRETKID